MALFSGGKKAANTATQYATLGATLANQNIDQGQQRLETQYGNAQSYYQPYADTFSAGSQMYANSLGLNGAEGNQAAVSAFQAGPGYDFAVNQGLDAIDRRASARGMLGSGNTSTDTINYANGMANQEYGNWQNNLSGYNNLGLATVGQQAGLTTGIGDAAYSTGVSKANILNGLGTSTASAQMQGAAQDSAATQGLIAGGLTLGSRLLGLGVR